MGFFEDAAFAAKDIAEKAYKKAEKAVDYSKYRFTVNDLERKLEKKYTALGKLRYDEIKNDVQNSEKKHQIIEEIDHLKTEILGRKKEYADSRKNICQSCLAENEKDAEFCNRCGIKL